MAFTTPYVRRPYQPREYEVRQYDDRSVGRLSDLMRSQGQVRGEAARRQGDISARTLSDIGQLTAQTVQQLGQIPAQRQRQEEQALLNQERRQVLDERQQATAARNKAGREESTAKGIMGLSLIDGPNGVKTYDRDLIAREFQAAGIADRLPTVMAGLDAFEKSALEFKTAKQAYAQKAMQPRLALVAAMDFDPFTFEKVAEEFVANGFMSPDEVFPLVKKAQTPEAVKQIVMGLGGQAAPKQEGFTLNPGDVRFGPDGKQIASVPAAERAASNPTEASLAAAAAAGDPKAAEALKILQRQAAASRAPREQSKFWVIRDGKQIRIAEDEYRPGDLNANTREQGRPVTSGDAGRIADFDSSLTLLRDLAPQLAKPGATGLGAQMAAATPLVTQLTGWGADAKAQQAVINQVKQVIGKALEGGVLRKEDEIKYAKILPVIGDEASVAAAKIDGLLKTIAQKRQNQLDALADAGYDVSRFMARESEGGPTPRTDGPDLSGLREGTERVFRSGPFAGQSWAVIDGKPVRRK